MIARGTPLVVSGCFIQEKSILGRTLAEIETLLGFHNGRLRDGMDVVALGRLPELAEFDLAAYTSLVTLREEPPEGIDLPLLKEQSRAAWSTAGYERIVKVLPARRRDVNVNPDIQAPPGLGVPQWIARLPVPGLVVAVCRGYPSQRYTAVY
jgi:hypothetical protein